MDMDGFVASFDSWLRKDHPPTSGGPFPRGHPGSGPSGAAPWM